MHWKKTVLLAIGFGAHAGSATALQDHPPHHVFELGDFRLESGEVLRDAHLLYATQGQLNADGSNAILLPTAFFGTHHGYDRLIGPERTPTRTSRSYRSSSGVEAHRHRVTPIRPSPEANFRACPSETT